MLLRSVNPATEVLLAQFEEDSSEQTAAKIEACAEAFQSWSRTSFSERRSLMLRAGEVARAQRASLSTTIAEEMGQPIVQAEQQVDRFAGRCEYFAENAQSILRAEHIQTESLDNWIWYEPLGVALGIMPWNVPVGLASRWLVPALMAGNGAMVKHASNATLSGLAFEEVFRAAGWPPGLIATLLVSSQRMSAIVADPRIASVSLTGGGAAGRAVGAVAGAHTKKMVLELGGSDPFIILADADIESTAAAASTARYSNAGQNCTAAKRFIVVDRVADAFTEQFVVETKKLKVGDPLDRTTDVGPLARSDIREQLIRQCEATLAAGARVAYQAALCDGPGYFFSPTVLVDVTPEMVAAQEETFGPLAVIIRVADEATAIQVANQSSFGLGATIWTRDTERGINLAHDLECGMVAINSRVPADPRLPFGGTKLSGFGREMSAHGLREMTNIKLISVMGASPPTRGA